MSLLIDTDDEMNRYDEAALYAKTVKPDLAPGIRSSFNVGTGQTDLLAPLPSGGFVKLGSQAPEITVEAPEIMMEAPAMPGMGADAALPVEDDEFQLQSIRNYAASGANISSRDDYLAAGYTDQQIDASGVMGETQQKTGRTEPLSTTEIEDILSKGGTVFQNSDPTMRENGAAALTETLIELRVDERREELMAQGVDTAEISRIIASEQPEMRSLSENLADAVFGNKNVLGTGVGDFVTAGVMDMQEGWRMYTDALRNDSPANRALGVLLMAAGVAEATGVGMVLGKTIKKSIPMMQSAMVSAGQNAELRMAERGPAVDFLSSTMMSGVDPTIATDPLVAAAGRAVGGDRVAEIKTRMQQIQDDRRISKTLSGEGELRKLKRELKEIDQSGDGNFSIVEPPTDTKPGVIAFHGSAADFDGFKLEKIGTGEGAQAYGYGLYFADSEEIAKFYKESLTEVPADYQIDGQSVSAMYNQAINNENYELAEVLEQVQLHDAPKDLKERFTIDGGYSQETQDFVRDLDYDNLTGVNADGEEIELGRVYKVGLTPKPEDLLDYDKPFSEQTPIIQAALKKAGYKTERNMVVKEDGDNRFGVYETNDDGTETLLKHFTEPMLFKGPLEKQAQDFIVEQNAELLNNTGGQILTKLADQLGKTIRPVPLSADGTMMPTEQIASKALFEAGIPGIKYLDNTSRDGAGTSSNYVIFDDSMIKILEKYGIVGPVAISAMALSEDES